MTNTETKCACQACANPGCQCGAKPPQAEAGCCCGAACQCGEACKCPPSCGCPASKKP